MSDSDTDPQLPDRKTRASTFPHGKSARGQGADDAKTAPFGSQKFSDSLGAGPPAGDRHLPAGLANHPRYQILDQLGAGGMGTVHRAWHRFMDRLVALKVINGALLGSPITVERFHREIKAAARLDHPNIVTAYDADYVGDTHFFVMEYVRGVNLDQLIAEHGRLSVMKACDYARQTALGLQHAHECGMVHRDIKPHNLMLTDEGRVKILDFGLALFAKEARRSGLDQEATISVWAETAPGLGDELSCSHAGMGSADYIAPEEAVDPHRADIRADIYSLGCVLYRFLIGDVPFPHGDRQDKLQRHIDVTPPRLIELRAEVPERLAQIVERMMAKEPAQRYQTPADVAQALVAFALPSTRHILIVASSSNVREVMAATLEIEGYSATCVADGREARDQLRQSPPPSLILLDTPLHFVEAWQFLQAQPPKTTPTAIPVIVVAARDQAQARAAARSAIAFLQSVSK